ncbi:MAG TPA: PAS domain-containing sensor histidine kinase [Candidatus Thermoplasmatota archaeon]|nr:PAS domain-containing sensor histidine kinase [Candidatus Thermoplasmatota archaeon]
MPVRPGHAASATKSAKKRPGRRAKGAFERHGSLEGVVHSLDLESVLVEGAKDFAIFAMDPEGTIVSWNEGAQRLTGYTEEEAVGKSFSLLWTAEDQAERKHERELHLATSKGIAEDQNWIQRRDGSRFWAHGTTRTLLDDNQRMRGFVKVMRDLTAQREAEMKLRDAHERLRQFQNQVVHELRNPMSPILMQLQILRMSGLSATQAKAVDVLARNVWRMNRLCDDLADAARLERGTFEINRRPLDMGTILKEAADGLEEVARDAKVKLKVEAKPGLMVSGDAHRLAQVLHNLVMNAIRFTPPGGTVTLSCAPWNDGQEVMVRVRDTGIGLTPQQMAQLFLPFSQVHSSGQSAGMGLGLYLSKFIIQGHDGTLDVESGGVHQGSTFFFVLPSLEGQSRTHRLDGTAGPPMKAQPI